MKHSVEDELIALKEENLDLSSQYEEAISLSNILTVDNEIAQLQFDQIFDAVGDALWIIDEDNTVLRINSAFVNLLKLKSKTAAIGKKCYELLASDLCQANKCPLKRIRKGTTRVDLDIELEITKGKRTHFLLTGTPLYGLTNEIIGIVVQFKDITKRKNYEKAIEKANIKLKKLSTIDGLTQLANRRVFDETLQKEWQRMRRSQQPLSVILSDIDFFKRYNDTYGHQKGDDCLKTVAESIKNCVLRPADLAARYGGEEFVIILPDTPSKGAFHVAETIRDAVLSMKMEHAGSEVNDFVSLSLGVATLIPPKDGGKAEELVKIADEALYVSKNAGRNMVTVSDNNQC